MPWYPLLDFGLPHVHDMGHQKKNEKFTVTVFALLILVFSHNLSATIYILESSNSC